MTSGKRHPTGPVAGHGRPVGKLAREGRSLAVAHFSHPGADEQPNGCACASTRLEVRFRDGSDSMFSLRAGGLSPLAERAHLPISRRNRPDGEIVVQIVRSCEFRCGNALSPSFLEGLPGLRSLQNGMASRGMAPGAGPVPIRVGAAAAAAGRPAASPRASSRSRRRPARAAPAPPGGSGRPAPRRPPVRGPPAAPGPGAAGPPQRRPAPRPAFGTGGGDGSPHGHLPSRRPRRHTGSGHRGTARFPGL
jgi:hypothetical protein